MSLRRKTISGLFWTFSQQFSVQAINFIVQVVLARILLPEDFGLIAMLSIFMSVGNSLVDSGMTSSLIRTKDVDETDYSTVFYMNLIVSVGVYITLFLNAPLIADFFNQPRLSDIIRVYTITFIIRALSQVQQTKLTKEMRFKLQMMIQIPSVIISGILGVTMAYYGMGVWALVWMSVIQAGISAFQLWIRGGWYPEMIIDLGRLKAHFNFGYKLTLSGLLNTLFSNIYNVVIGKHFSAAQLGFYNRADTLRMFPVQNLSTALNKVTYPMFAAVQDDNVKLRNAYRIVMRQVLFWLAPLLAVLIVLAEPIFRLVLTEKWLPAVQYFQLLCLSGLLIPVHSYNLNILNVKGRSDLFLKLELLKKGIITIGIVCAVPFGIFGLIYFQLISSVLSFFINTYYSGRIISYGAFRQLRDILPVIIIAGIIGIITWWLLEEFIMPLKWPDLAVISLVGLTYFGAYLGLSFFFELAAFHDFNKLVLKR